MFARFTIKMCLVPKLHKVRVRVRRKSPQWKQRHSALPDRTWISGSLNRWLVPNHEFQLLLDCCQSFPTQLQVRRLKRVIACHSALQWRPVNITPEIHNPFWPWHHCFWAIFLHIDIATGRYQCASHHWRSVFTFHLQDLRHCVSGTFDLGAGTVLCRFLHEQNDRTVNHTNHSVNILHTCRCVKLKHQHH